MAGDPRFGAFFMLTGVTFTAFASGFGVCLFNLDTVGQCAAVASHWLDVFHAAGDHIIAWAIALFHAVMSQR